MLEHFFGSKTRLKLLQIFYRAPERHFYGRELARLAETQLNAVRREIANLERLGILIAAEAAAPGDRPAGNERAKFYRLHADSLLYDELRALLIKGELLEEEELIRALQARSGKISLLLMTGIFAHDAEAPTDLLIVGRLRPLVIAKIMAVYEKRLGRTVRYTLMDDKEFRDRREIGDKFLYSVFEAKHTLVVDKYQLS